MAFSFLHDITTTVIDSGPRPIAVPSSSMIGLVDTYTPGTDLAQPDVPVQITNPHEATQAFDQNSAIPRTINAIYARTSAIIVGMGVAKTDDANVLTSGIIGGVMPGYAPVYSRCSMSNPASICSRACWSCPDSPCATPSDALQFNPTGLKMRSLHPPSWPLSITCVAVPCSS